MRTFILFVLTSFVSFAWAECPSLQKHRFELIQSEKNWILEFNQSGVILKLPAQIGTELRQFHKKIKARINPDPVLLAKRQSKFFQHQPNEFQKFDLFLDGDWGLTSRIRCVESFLLSLTMKQFRSDSIEFAAFVLERSTPVLQTKILAWSSRMDGMVKRSDEMLRRLQLAQSRGWRLKVHLHNHPFSLERGKGDIGGTLIPSAPDLKLYRSLQQDYQLPEAWITNGFHTSRYSEF